MPLALAINILIGILGYVLFGWLGALGFPAGLIVGASLLVWVLERIDRSTYMWNRRMRQRATRYNKASRNLKRKV